MTDGLDGIVELRKRFDAIKDTHQLLGQLALLAVANAKDIVPRKTGNLGRTIRLGLVTNESAQIIAGGQGGVGYARAVEYGTRPHDILPRNRKALAWGGDRRLSGSLRTGGKATHFAKRVHHPGTKAKPYLMPGAEKAVADVGIDIIVKAWNDAA